MKTWRQRLAAVLEWSEVDKSIFVMLLLIPILGAYIASIIALQLMPNATLLVHLEPLHELLKIELGLLFGALVITGVGIYLRKRRPTTLWIQHLATQYYSLSLITCSYYIGTLTFCTGVVLLGAPVFGFILLNRRVVWGATIVSTIALLGLTYATAYGWLPYAPAVIPPTNSATNLIWVNLIFFYTAPHFIVIIMFADQILHYWRNREDTIRTLSRTDMLTSLLNRRSIMELLDMEVARTLRHGPPLTIVILDLDHFKRINDTWGHPTGDRVLKEAARILTTCIRKCDLVGRFGGEEFMIMLPDTTLAGAATLIERCRAILAETTILADNGDTIHISGSFGLASNENRLLLSTEAMIKLADEALYRAKAEGRNRLELALPFA
ncbi:MAG: GGDEF domain-containing protein [Agitococcus sp.]|nr:GGDEF domain-containing protein [Agitococcus sp.]